MHVLGLRTDQVIDLADVRAVDWRPARRAHVQRLPLRPAKSALAEW